MKPEKTKRLDRKGWKVGSAEEFLEPSPQEAALVELRLKLADAVRLLRKDRHLTQTQLAELLASSQSRVAKVEAAAGSVSLELLIRSYLAMGATTDDLPRVYWELLPGMLFSMRIASYAAAQFSCNTISRAPLSPSTHP